jgi:hypothetical protein
VKARGDRSRLAVLTIAIHGPLLTLFCSTFHSCHLATDHQGRVLNNIVEVILDLLAAPHKIPQLAIHFPILAKFSGGRRIEALSDQSADSSLYSRQLGLLRHFVYP